MQIIIFFYSPYVIISATEARNMFLFVLTTLYFIFRYGRLSCMLLTLENVNMKLFEDHYEYNCRNKQIRNQIVTVLMLY